MTGLDAECRLISVVVPCFTEEAMTRDGNVSRLTSEDSMCARTSFPPIAPRRHCSTGANPLTLDILVPKRPASFRADPFRHQLCRQCFESIE